MDYGNYFTTNYAYTRNYSYANDDDDSNSSILYLFIYPQISEPKGQFQSK